MEKHYYSPDAEILCQSSQTLLCNSTASETEQFEDLTTVEW